MAQRDYKNGAAPRRGRGGRSGRKGGSAARSALFVVLIAVGLAGVALWKLWPRPSDFRPSDTAPALRPPPAGQPAAAPAVPENADKAGDYTFYDILPGNRAPKPLPAGSGQAQWWLQVAALKNAADADALRARLTLLNFNAIVRPTPAGETSLYRVRVGPYPNQAAAEAAQKNLAANNFEARPVKEAVIP